MGLNPASRRVPRAVWALGFTSLFMDTASEAIHGLLPIFIVQTLGASVVVLGLLEGLAEGLTAITKLGSGLLSDRLGMRKPITIAGYLLAAISKPLFAVATNLPTVFFARFSDRFGKGIRGAPRDALIADITPPELRGAAYGLRQSLDTIGAVAGPLAAIALMTWFDFSVREVFWAAAIPAALAVVVLFFGVDEPSGTAAVAKERWSWRGVGDLPRAFWLVVALGGALTMARFSEAFLILRAQDQGLALALAPAVLIVMNLVYALVSFPAGVLADRVPPWLLLAAACATLIAADGVLAAGQGVGVTGMGIALWGLHMGLTQGVLSAIVGLVAPAHVRATAFGFFNLVLGIMMVISSVLAGVLWDYAGPAATFMAGGGFAMLTLIGAVALGPHLTKK